VTDGDGSSAQKRAAGGRGARAETSARDVARRVLDRVDKGAWATLALDGELARSGLEDRDRRLASELVYGVLRNRSRIDRALAAHAELKRTPPRVVTALRVAAYQLLFLDRVPSYAAVDDAVRAARAVGGPKLAGFCNAVLRKLAAGGEPALPAGGRERIEVEHSLPRWIADELAAAVSGARVGEVAAVSSARDGEVAVISGARDGEVAAISGARDGEVAAIAGARGGEVAAISGARLGELAAALAQPAQLVARVNALRTTRDELIERLRGEGVGATPLDGVPMAVALDGAGDPARSATFGAGLWTVQDAGAQLVSLAAAPRPGQRILDACAGVGGKSTHLAELARDAAAIDAADLSQTKLDLAAGAARRLGVASIEPRLCDLLDPAAPLAASYDLIVLDAPCTGLGVLRRHPDAKWRLTAADVPRLAALQCRLLDAVVPRLGPGGALIYSVCTFTVAEGPAQVAALVERTGLRLVEERRTWPPGADAFYIARLER
jgi:16S rRNA (cytosine967-C5)-methyltransferase